MATIIYTYNNGNSRTLDATDFAGLLDTIKASRTATKSAYTTLADRDARAYYKQVCEKLQAAIIHRYKASMQDNAEAAKAAEVQFYAAYQRYLDMLGQDYKAQHFDILNAVPFAVSKRNIGNKEYRYNNIVPTGENTFCKGFELALCIMLERGEIKTLEQVKAERTAKQKAKREAAKAARQAMMFGE